MSSLKQSLPLSEPCIAGNEWKYVKECLDDGWVSSAGPFVDRFESEFSRYVGAAKGLAIVNGTCGLHVALLASGIRPGDEVIVSNLTFVAPVNAIRYCGAYPVFMDADRDTWQMDVDKLQQFLATECQNRPEGCINTRTNRRIRAILPVHILGFCCDIARIVDLANMYGLKVIEDASQALGVLHEGRHVGTFGDAGVFSFNGNKIVTTGGGGMIVTNSPSIAEKVAYLTTQAKDDELEYYHKEIGFNYRLTNVQAAIGVAQLEQIDGFIDKRRAIADMYRKEFAETQVEFVKELAQCRATYWLYTVLLPSSCDISQRKKVIARLRAAGVGARPLWYPIHDLPPHRDCQAYRIEHSIRLYERAVSLPSSCQLTPDQVQFCAGELQSALNSL